ncbi:MAG TPA: hypothetical protein DCS23_03850 [Candidatus Yonathbacteria bacterium]|nr:hypothetical protein [Candidatus Yonathbacteria bacterium]
MSNEVQFDIDQVQHTTFKPKESVLVRLIIKYSGGFVKDEKQANYVLIGFVVVAIIVSSILFFDGGDKTQFPNPLTDYKYHPPHP